MVERIFKKNISWGNCVSCGEEITEEKNNLGYDIESGYLCQRCYEKRIPQLIDDTLIFVKSKDFQNELEVRKKILWLSEKMGYWHDNVDKSITESIGDYYNRNIRSLQVELLDEIINLMQEDNRDLTVGDGKEIINLQKKIALLLDKNVRGFEK